MFDRSQFYNLIRGSLFKGKLTFSQVAGMDDLLDAAEGLVDANGAAYIFAGVYHETGKLMVPVREGFASTDAGARAAVAKLKADGKIKTNYALPVNGVSYYGRGRIQNTHKYNYEKLKTRFGFDFVANPDLLLDSSIDAVVTVIGHVEGIWTGKKLSNYGSDFKGARAIVNGTDKATAIAGYANKFLEAFKQSGWEDPVPTEGVKETYPTIRKGDKGDYVKVWQIILGMTGKDVDGIFGTGTHNATVKWQKAHGLVADGIVGSNTWSKADV